MRLLHVFWVCYFLMTTLSAFANSLEGGISIMKANDLNEIQEAVKDVQEDDVVFLDVDDTLITPKAKIFRPSSPFRTFIDDYKAKYEKTPGFEKNLSHWRLKRKVMLLDTRWPAFIKALKAHCSVYALTKMVTGAFGDIRSSEKWRFNELEALGITFSAVFQGTPDKIMLDHFLYPATFYMGIFSTGAFTKGEVVDAYLKLIRPRRVIFIDDRPEHIQSVAQVCEKHNVPFLGILYEGYTQLEGAPDLKVAEYQKDHFLKSGEWLEDEEAEKLIS